MIFGRGPAPSHVLLLIQRLPEDSLTIALASGGRKLFGWSANRALLSDIFDAINLNTRATGMWDKGKAPKFPPAARPSIAPGSADPAKPRATTVADLYQRFTKGGK